MNEKPKINYPELGGVDKQKRFYGEGEEFAHPSGVVYVRRKGNWVIKGSKKDEDGKQPS